MNKRYFLFLFLLFSSSVCMAQCLSDTSKAHSGHGYVGKIGKTSFFYHYWSYKTDKGYLNTLLILKDSTISAEYDICLNNDHSSITYYKLTNGKRMVADTSVSTRTIPGCVGFLKLGDENNWTLDKLSTLSSLMKLYTSGNDLYFQYVELDSAKGLILHKLVYDYENEAFVMKKEESTVLSSNPEER